MVPFVPWQKQEWSIGTVRHKVEGGDNLNNHTCKRKIAVSLTCLAVALTPGCSKKPAPEQTASSSAGGATTQPANAPSAAKEAASTASVTLPAPFGHYTDDLDAMLKRRNIRAIVLLNPIGFFYDNKGHPMGVMFEALRELEAYVNKKYKTGTLSVKVSFIPLRPDQVEAGLEQGVGDLVAYALVVTPEREQKVTFTSPLQTNVKQIVVSGPNFGDATTVEALGGKQIYVNPLTVNYQRLQELNANLKKEGKPTIDVKTGDPNLLDDDLLQMVNAGLLPATVTEERRAKLWSQVLPNLQSHPDLVIASGEQRAWALRKSDPQLKQLLDEFVQSHAVGTSFGSTLTRRYLQNTKFVKDNRSEERH